MGIQIFYTTTHSSKSYKMRNIHSIRGTTWNIAIQKGKIYNIKIKVIAFIINLEDRQPLEIDTCKSKKGASVSKVLALLLVQTFKKGKIWFTSFKKINSKQVRRVSETSHFSCLCQTCCNVALKVEALKQFAKKQTETILLLTKTI